MAARRPVRPLLTERIGGRVRLIDVRRLLVLLPLALLACGDDAETTAPPTTTTTVDDGTTTTVVEGTTSTSVPPPGMPALEDGRHFGFIERIYGESATFWIQFDLAQLLVGEEANAAAVEDGVIEPGEDVPNDHYVRNENERVRSYPLRDPLEIRVVERECCDLRPLGSAEELYEWYRASDPHGFGGAGASWWLTVEDGVVVGIEEQYRP